MAGPLSGSLVCVDVRLSFSELREGRFSLTARLIFRFVTCPRHAQQPLLGIAGRPARNSGALDVPETPGSMRAG